MSFFQEKQKKQNARRVLRRSASLRRSAINPVNKYPARPGEREGVARCDIAHSNQREILHK